MDVSKNVAKRFAGNTVFVDSLATLLFARLLFIRLYQPLVASSFPGMAILLRLRSSFSRIDDRFRLLDFSRVRPSIRRVSRTVTVFTFLVDRVVSSQDRAVGDKNANA